MDERLPITESRIAAARLVIVSLAELPADDTGAPAAAPIPISELSTCGAGKWNGVAPSFVGRPVFETAGGENGVFPEGSHHAFSSGSLLVRLGGGGQTVLETVAAVVAARSPGGGTCSTGNTVPPTPPVDGSRSTIPPGAAACAAACAARSSSRALPTRPVSQTISLISLSSSPPCSPTTAVFCFASVSAL